MEKNEMILWKYWIIVHATWIELNSNLIEEEWDANWYIRHWKHACDFGVDRKNKNFEKI
jgi:hypothetical protein